MAYWTAEGGTALQGFSLNAMLMAYEIVDVGRAAVSER